MFFVFQYFQGDDESSASSGVGSSSSGRTVGGVNVLSITPDGKEAFNQAVAAYLAKIDNVEAELEAKIREFLDRAKDDSNEMFRGTNQIIAHA